MKYASLLKRGGAFFLDSFFSLCLFSLLIIPIFILHYFVVSVLDISGIEILASVVTGGVSIVLVFFAMFYFFVWSPYKHNGQSLGKKIFSIRVITERGMNLTLNEYLIRFLVLYFTYSFGWLVVIFDDRNKGIHDYIYQTIVVEV